jgi:hypothetical protein
MAQGSAEPVRIYVDEDRRLPVRLSAAIEREIAQRTERLTKGNAVKDFAEYQRIVGVIEGLKFALDQCANITKDLSGQ